MIIESEYDKPTYQRKIEAEPAVDATVSHLSVEIKAYVMDVIADSMQHERSRMDSLNADISALRAKLGNTDKSTYATRGWVEKKIDNLQASIGWDQDKIEKDVKTLTDWRTRLLSIFGGGDRDDGY
jgi:hypothetical protein|tara:strand:+ start:851 stop:1228 length:378 start_codon:yes stop_codon:yes gene_type:complete